MSCSSPVWLVLHGKLARGRCVLVDEGDLLLVGHRRWFARESHGHTYAVGHPPRAEPGTSRIMHRHLMSCPADALVDHENGNGLDNRRHNLRVCTVRHNRQNSRSGRRQRRGLFKGIREPVLPRNPSWRAKITVCGKEIHLGSFPDAESAARAYDRAARLHFGEFAAVNFPDEP